MSESPTDRDVVRQMSDDSIQHTFDDLVEYWEASEEARYALEGFQRDNQPPQPPDNPIENLEELINYNRQKWGYELEVENRAARRMESEARFEALARYVRYLLPEGWTLTHIYGGPTDRFIGNVYTINHTPGERNQPGVISVAKKGHPPSA